MLVSVYGELSLFNAHAMILIFHIFMKVNKLCLNQNSTQRTIDNKAGFQCLWVVVLKHGDHAYVHIHRWNTQPNMECVQESQTKANPVPCALLE